jgi:hypothetical protein
VRTRLALSAIDVVSMSWINTRSSLRSSLQLALSSSNCGGEGAHNTSGVVVVIVADGVASAAST